MGGEPRIGLIGPRRARQGLGPFFARFAERAGGRIAAVAGRDPKKIGSTAEALERKLGHAVRACPDLATLLEEGLDAVILASPWPAHEEGLRACLGARLPVLCEKPLVWGGEDPARRGEALVRGFEVENLPLEVHVQWPLTLPAFFTLYPGLRGRGIESFFQLLSPSSRGPAALPDSLPHPLSLLQALLPDPGAEILEPGFEIRDPTDQTLRFLYRALGREVRCRIDLRTRPEPPRPASLGLNGCLAERRIRLPDYALFFDGDGERVRSMGGPPSASVPVPDPMEAFVRGFLDRLRGKEGPVLPVPPVKRLRMLETLVSAYPKNP